MTPRSPEEVALSQNGWAPGPPRESRTPAGSGPHMLFRPLSREGTVTPPRGGSGAATCPQAQVRARLPSFLWKTCPPITFNAGDVKCALLQQSPRRLLPGCTVGRASVGYAS